MKSTHTVKVIGTKSHSSLLAECLREAAEDEIPEGAVCVYDLIAADNTLTRSKADGILRRKEQAGKLRSVKCRRRHGGKMRSVTYYLRKETA